MNNTVIRINKPSDIKILQAIEPDRKATYTVFGFRDKVLSYGSSTVGDLSNYILFCLRTYKGARRAVVGLR